MIKYNDYEHLLCVEWYGSIDIVNLLTWEVAKSFKISSGMSINDIAELETSNQYALGLENGGVQIVEIKATESQFELK